MFGRRRRASKSSRRNKSRQSVQQVSAAPRSLSPNQALDVFEQSQRKNSSKSMKRERRATNTVNTVDTGSRRPTTIIFDTSAFKEYSGDVDIKVRFQNYSTKHERKQFTRRNKELKNAHAAQRLLLPGILNSGYHSNGAFESADDCVAYLTNTSSSKRNCTNVSLRRRCHSRRLQPHKARNKKLPRPLRHSDPFSRPPII
jgi:hypothetical protein